MTSVLERELQAETTKRARHAIAQELDIYLRANRRARGYGWDDKAKQWKMQFWLTENYDATTALHNLAKIHFPRVHPAPGKLPWCLVNTHGPVCDNRAEPGSDFCKAHAQYEDGAPQFGWGNPPMGNRVTEL